MCKPTNDLYQAFYWSDINHYLPTDNQINSLMKVCNGNEKVLFELNPGNLSNLLGLKWGKGAFRHLSGSSYDKFDTEAIVFPHSGHDLQTGFPSRDCQNNQIRKSQPNIHERLSISNDRFH